LESCLLSELQPDKYNTLQSSKLNPLKPYLSAGASEANPFQIPEKASELANPFLIDIENPEADQQASIKKSNARQPNPLQLPSESQEDILIIDDRRLDEIIGPQKDLSNPEHAIDFLNAICEELKKTKAPNSNEKIASTKVFLQESS